MNKVQNTKVINKESDDVMLELEENTKKLEELKTKLQELIQADQRKTVTYSLLSTTGPANAPEFEVAVMMDDMTLGTGKGSSKKRAEQKAAKDALKKLAR